MATNTTDTDSRFSWRKLAITGVAAALIGTVSNLIYYPIAMAVTGVDVEAPIPGPDGVALGEVGLIPVFIASFVFLLIATAVYGAVLRFAPSNAEAIYLVIAVFALLLSYVFPSSYLNPIFPTDARWVLGGTHVVAAVAGVMSMLTIYRRL